MEKFICRNGNQLSRVVTDRILLAQVQLCSECSEPAIRFEQFRFAQFIQSYFLQANLLLMEFALVTALFLLLFTTGIVRALGFDDPNSGNKIPTISPYHILVNRTFNVQLYAYFAGNYIDSDTVAVTSIRSKTPISE